MQYQMTTKIVMPEMGEGVIEGTIGRWLKKEGDRVEEFEPLLEIETDKVTTEAVAEASGTLLKINVGAGETVEVGAVLGVIGEATAQDNERSPVTTQPAAATRQRLSDDGLERTSIHGAAVVEHQRRANGAGKSAEARRKLGRISPVVSRMAEENGIDLFQVVGSGRNGRITKQDMLAYIELQEQTKAQGEPANVEPQLPKSVVPLATERSATGNLELAPADTLLPMTSIRRAIAKHMVDSKRTSPHVTTVFEVDFSVVDAHRKRNKADFASQGVKLTFTPYIMHAVAHALREHPIANSNWSDDGIILRGAINLGMATAIEQGLIVPVIKGADELNLLGMARRVNDLAERARRNRLKPDELTGGTFSVTNHGVTGSVFATPIINQPQVGILGVGKIQKRVVVVESEFGDTMAIRLIAFLSFTFDHRVLDGASADAFVAAIVKKLENWS
jgi:2-oxoglutarate dehydrogenase E2 component (dihydrolipoamide succinyltransferase)